jgi:hypothetical protein
MSLDIRIVQCLQFRGLRQEQLDFSFG